MFPITQYNFNINSSLTSQKYIRKTRDILAKQTVADLIANILYNLGVRHAFGVSGGAIAPIWEALEKSPIEVLHFRHEGGAVFAAMEAYFGNNQPVVVFTTTGPGLTNALTGIAAARMEGAKVVLISACTPQEQIGKCAFQETELSTMPEDFFKSGSVFNYAHKIHSGDELAEIHKQLEIGFNSLGSFVAHISTPVNIQISLNNYYFVSQTQPKDFTCNYQRLDEIAEILSTRHFAIWLGFGALNASEEIVSLAEKTGALVMSSPRGKGIFPEKHPQYLGVTGFAGHNSVLEYMSSTRPEYILVLGTRLGEFTSFWNRDMIPSSAFIHVDIDPSVPGASFTDVNTFSICGEIKSFLKQILPKLPAQISSPSVIKINPRIVNNGKEETKHEGLVRPHILMTMIQKVMIDTNNVVIIAEAGNSFAWTTHYLKFNQPKYWRVSTNFGAIGNASTGVIGSALINGKAVAILGDGAMLMNNEINTAVAYNIPCVWIILNDACYNMCAQGMAKLGYSNAKPGIHPTDFVMFARSMGADGIAVENEFQIESALLKAMDAKIPFVVDVKIDPSEQAPIGKRISNLLKQKAETSD